MRALRLLCGRMLRLPGHTVRVRLTALYGILFVLSGALLLAIASGAPRPPVGPRRTRRRARRPGAGLAQERARTRVLQTLINQLQSQAAAQPGQQQLSHVLLSAALIALAIMTVVSLLLGWVVAGRALRPVREMTAAAQRISEKNLDERLEVPGPKDELKELGDTIDGLLERLEAAFKAQRRFVANASHELRTPLTTMRASLDVALAKPEPAPPQTVALAGRLRTELDKIDQLLEAFLSWPGPSTAPARPGGPAARLPWAPRLPIRPRHQRAGLTVQAASDPGGAWVEGSQASSPAW